MVGEIISIHYKYFPQSLLFHLTPIPIAFIN